MITVMSMENCLLAEHIWNHIEKINNSYAGKMLDEKILFDIKVEIVIAFRYCYVNKVLSFNIEPNEVTVFSNRNEINISFSERIFKLLKPYIEQKQKLEFLENLK